MREPHDAADELAVWRHFCLASFLLDGHHRVFAAAQEDRPMTLLSFLALEPSIATEEDVQTVLEALRA